MELVEISKSYDGVFGISKKERVSRMQKVADREAVIQDRIKRRAAGENLPLEPKLDRQYLRERVRRVAHGIGQAPQAAKDIRAASENANKIATSYDPVKIERIANNVRQTAGHIEGAANSRLASGIGAAAERGAPKIGSRAGLAALGAAGTVAAGLGGVAATRAARRQSQQLLHAAAKRQRGKTAALAGAVGLGGALVGSGAATGATHALARRKEQ